MASAGLVVLGTFAALASMLYGPVSQRLVTLGVTRPLDKIVNDHGHDFRLIEGTVQCEDLHHHLDSGLLFTACQGKAPLDRLSWFPPLAVFSDHKAARNGELVIVDPQTFKATSLKLAGFKGPLVTHGIDVITDPEDAGLVHIFAVNHLPNPLHYRSATERDTKHAEVRSQIELFTHRLGSDTATWRRSVRDNLIRTPNDILATSPTSFYVTNDHHFRSGFGRLVEDVMFEKLASWTDTVYVQIGDPDLQTDPDLGKFAVKVLHAMHNNNGLGRSALPGEVLIGNAADGVMYRAAVNSGNPGLKLIDWVQVDSMIDNPSWFHDPFANATHDSSGYVLAGLLRAVDLSGWTNPRMPIPAGVWHVRAGNRGRIETSGTHNDWDKRLIFVDDGKTARTLSCAVLVAIDPAGNGGRKQAWLFATGFASDAMVATRVDL